VTFIVGALVLFNSVRLPGYPAISIPLVIGTGLVLGAFFFAIVSIGVRAQKKPVIAGVETIVNKTGYAVTDINPDGEVQVASERWSASLEKNDPAIPAGSRIVVTAVNGLRLRVKLYKDGGD
ncbi:MAG: hypothetical protein GYA12_01810, partial [Chloroflexi bacterium]|nr:hypothetical protein [Chloroflexota bacterium]